MNVMVSMQSFFVLAFAIALGPEQNCTSSRKLGLVTLISTAGLVSALLQIRYGRRLRLRIGRDRSQNLMLVQVPALLALFWIAIGVWLVGSCYDHESKLL